MCEDIAVIESVKDAMFMKDVLGLVVPGREGESINLPQGNEMAGSPTNNPSHSARSRHVNVRNHVLRGNCQRRH